MRVLFALMLLVGCGSVVAKPEPDAPEPRAFALTVQEQPFVVRTGGENVLTVSVERAGVQGPIAITVDGRPNTVTVSSLTLEADQTTGEVTFNAADSAEQGILEITVSAIGEGVDEMGNEATSARTLELVVAGGRGSRDLTFTSVALNNLNEVGKHVVLPDGSLIIPTVVYNPTSGVRTLSLVRLGSDGVRDTSFGASFSYTAPSLGEISVARQSTGRLLVAGTASKGFILGVTASGEIDDTFTAVGVNVDGETADGVTTVADLHVLDDDRVIAVVKGQSSSQLMRFSADGTRDTTYVAEPLAGALTLGSVLPDGSVIVAGRSGSQVIVERHGPGGMVVWTQSQAVSAAAMFGLAVSGADIVLAYEATSRMHCIRFSMEGIRIGSRQLSLNSEMMFGPARDGMRIDSANQHVMLAQRELTTNNRIYLAIGRFDLGSPTVTPSADGDWLHPGAVDVRPIALTLDRYDRALVSTVSTTSPIVRLDRYWP
jgi:hypothetical protein